jgi:type VI secretion system protein ImpC
MSEITTDIKSFLTSVNLPPPEATPQPMIKAGFEGVVEQSSASSRFYSTLAAVAFNMEPEANHFDKQSILALIRGIDQLVENQLNEIIQTKEFRDLEGTWRSIADLVDQTDFAANVSIGLLDAEKAELQEDLELNLSDIAGSELFKKVYIKEYDQYGGAPYGTLLGLYEFNGTDDDLTWLKGISKVAAASHAPFIGSVSPSFFNCQTAAEVNQLRDIGGLFNTPRYAKWNKFREADEAAYVGLVMPRYMVRPPYHPDTWPAENINFREHVDGSDHEQYLWGSAALLFARNLIRSFQTSGWCQYIRGVKSGGQLVDLPTHTFRLRGENELKAPVEISMPDFREYELANAGFIPLVHRKGTNEAVFFSAQSIKKVDTFKDPKDSENSQLIANLSYTFSISRIAHYLKCIMRDNIGSTANGEYIYNQIDRWVAGYVTTLINPDDLTLRYYPFKAYSLDVQEVEGRVGWYHCKLSILPHIQFEGMDVDLRVDARLGAK